MDNAEDKFELAQMYKEAAKAAFNDGISAGDEPGLLAWVQANCRYRDDTLFFVCFGIGCELADLQSQARGFDSNVHEAFVLAKNKLEKRNVGGKNK